jgi:nitroimidazol reductase NimA-like FMN-containing flavoprotein (pyridoxamine 5'-phosphate oxidase superfamily)
MTSDHVEPAARARVRRHPERSTRDVAVANAVLDEGLVAHVAFVADHGPVVIPMVYARRGGSILLHGSPASRLLRTVGSGVDVCVAVTLIDGLVLARSAFHHSMNYRSVVVFGTATPLVGLGERREALATITERLAPARQGHLRPMTDLEVKATTVLVLGMDDVTVKARSGPPVDDVGDIDPAVWAGVIPLGVAWGAPAPDGTVGPDTVVPDHVAAMGVTPPT